MRHLAGGVFKAVAYKAKEHIPLQEGLRPHPDVLILDPAVVPSEHIPLQEGLRLLDGQVVICLESSPAEHIPSQEGL